MVTLPVVKIIVSLPQKVEERLRQHTHRRGDLSKIVTEAVEDWLAKKDGKGMGKKIV